MTKVPVQLLLVEDNSDQREIIIRAFRKKDPAIRITTTENGPACLEMLGRGHFDAIILDYSLPMLDGLEVMGQIQQQGYTVPVIMVTGQGDEQVAVEAMKRGAYDYIIKTRNYQETLPIVVQKVIEKNQLRKRLDEASLRTHRLYEISLSVTKKRRVEVLIGTLVEGARQLIQAEAALLLLIDPERAEVHQVSSSGFQIDPAALQGPVSSTGFFGLAYTQQQPVVIETPDQHPLWRTTPTHQPVLRQILAVPLPRQEWVGGVLVVANKQDTGPFVTEDIDTLSTLAVHATVAIDNARFLEEVERQAVTDSLTGFYNHQEFQKRLAEEVERGNRYGNPFSLLMLDIDHFKILNDTHGHVAGDTILKETVKIIRKSIRNVDIPSRYGGEEFTLILPETTGNKAKIVAERIRQSVEQASFMTPSGHPTHVSVSIGIASFPETANSREGLIISADQALYFAKEGGRNQVCNYGETLKSAIERDERKLNEILSDPKMKTLGDLAAAIDAKCPYTRGHTEGVLQYAILLADAMDLTEGEKKSLQLASLLHNIGTVGIPDTLLNKPTPLSPEEVKIIQAHPMLAQMLIRESTQWEAVLPAILYHHERYDGNGYPNGLRGEEIPFLARILGVVEAYHAMISVRPYRPKMTSQQAMSELQRNAGTQFDPRIVEAFVNLLNRSPSGKQEGSI